MKKHCTAVLLAIITSACESPSTPTSMIAGCPVGPYVPPPQTGWACPPLAVIREIDSHLSLQFEFDPTAGTLVCHAEDGSADLTRLQERTYQALSLIRQLEFDASLPWTNLSLWDWFIGEVRGIRFTPGGGGFCCEPLRMIVIGLSGNATIPPSFPTSEFVFVHEARHADQRHPHRCGQTKDVDIPQLGAFGVQYYLGVWIAEHTVKPALTAEERQFAKSSAEILRAAGGAFCTECGGI